MADICGTTWNVRVGPIADAYIAVNCLFDQLVGPPDERVGDVDAEGLCGPEVYDQFNFGRLKVGNSSRQTSLPCRFPRTDLGKHVRKKPVILVE